MTTESTPTSLEAAQRIKKSVEKEILSIPYVTGMSVGNRFRNGQYTNELGIQIYVSNQALGAANLPASIQGIPVDIHQAEFVKLASRAEIGSTIVPFGNQGSTGTLGLGVFDQAVGYPMLLTAYHVLQKLNCKAELDDQVLWRNEKGVQYPLAKFVRGELKDGGIDAAVAAIYNGQPISAVIPGIGRITGVGVATMGMHVRKLGITTQLTGGIIQRVSISGRATNNDCGEVVYSDDLAIVSDKGPDEFFARSGDSGSILVDDANRVVALLHSGAPIAGLPPHAAIAHPIQKVFAQLKVFFYDPEFGPRPLFRYYDVRFNDHFYTTNWAELGFGKDGMKYESTPCAVFGTSQPNTIPLYRYFNPVLGTHFYTTDAAEILRAPNRDQWKDEGIAGYVYPSTWQDPLLLPLHRYQHIMGKGHFYTTNFSDLGPTPPDWIYEGIQCRVSPWPLPQPSIPPI